MCYGREIENRTRILDVLDRTASVSSITKTVRHTARTYVRPPRANGLSSRELLVVVEGNSTACHVPYDDDGDDGDNNAIDSRYTSPSSNASSFRVAHRQSKSCLGVQYICCFPSI